MEDQRAKFKADAERPTDGKIQTTLSNLGQIKYDKDPKRQDRWDSAIVDVVVETGISFKSTESFRHLCNALWPSGTMKVEVRSGATVSKHVDKRNEVVQDSIYSIIQHAKKDTGLFGFTTYLWSNRGMVSFMSLSIHFIDSKFKMRKFLPFVEVFSGTHTGKNLSLKLSSFFERYGLDDPNICRVVVADNARNNKVRDENRIKND